MHIQLRNDFQPLINNLNYNRLVYGQFFFSSQFYSSEIKYLYRVPYDSYIKIDQVYVIPRESLSNEK